MEKKPWFKHSSEAALEPKLQKLIRKEGMKGYGIYWYIMESLCAQPNQYALISQLGSLVYRSSTNTKVIKRIIYDYDLFEIEEDMYYSKQLVAGKGSSSSISRPTSRPISSPISSPTFSSTFSPTFSPTSNLPEGINHQETNEIDHQPIDSSHVGARISPPPSIFILNKNKRKKRDAHEENDIKQDCMAMVDQLSADTQWVDDLWKTTQMNQAHLKQFPDVVEQFKRHIRLCGKEPDLPDLKSVKLYFINYLSADSRTGKKVREHLIATTPKPTAGDRGPDGSYLFEKIINGRRTFKGGIPLPDDAPPCPSVNAWWDQDRNYWID